ncbi:MAG: hypothetical protein DRO40_04340 [Thermoprotei archaeon]|nr:MAG: hypothetical protein DRO40_04340 [Thermoprotei archaeon]
MLANGKTTKEVARETGSCSTKLKKIREGLPLYVEVRELKEKLLKLKDEYDLKILNIETKYAKLRDRRDSLTKELEFLQRGVERIREEKIKLEGGG